MEKVYQDAQDKERIKHVSEITSIMMEYDQKVGYPPLYDLSVKHETPFMVLIGRSDDQEDYFAQLDIMSVPGGSKYINSKEFESILSRGLQRKVHLPRDPQKFASSAPNVYVYIVQSDQMCVGANVHSPSEFTSDASWEGKTFYRYGKCYSKQI